MAFVSDSRYAGYLGPTTTTPQDGDWDDIVHNLIAGITGLPPELIRPRWQTEPANMPPYDADWVAFGISRKAAEWDAVVQHRDDGEDGYDELQRTEVYDYSLTFYGPHCDNISSMWRDGLSIEQNRALLRANAAALVEVAVFQVSPELVNERWIGRADVITTFRRRVVRRYNVLHALRAQGVLTADGSAGPEVEFDTINEE